MEETKRAYKILVWIPYDKRPCARPRHMYMREWY